jgi:hypothetical protein
MMDMGLALAEMVVVVAVTVAVAKFVHNHRIPIQDVH